MEVFLFVLAIIFVGAVIEHQRGAIDRLQRVHSEEPDDNQSLRRRG